MLGLSELDEELYLNNSIRHICSMYIIQIIIFFLLLGSFDVPHDSLKWNVNDRDNVIIVTL
jgi:hypothetical protein